MKCKYRKTLFILYLFSIGIVLSAIVAAEDQINQTETYGAYPGAPTPAAGQPTIAAAYPYQPTPVTPGPTSGQPAIAAAYPYQTTPVTPTQVTQTALQMQVGPVTETAAAYPGAPSGTSAVTALYYTQAPPTTQQNMLLTYNIQTAPPTAVYYSGTFMPWTSFYQAFPANSPALWLATSAGWSWYATCPIGSWVQELMYVPYTGTMKLYELYPDGTVKLHSYGFVTPGYRYIWFYADTPGRHLTLFTMFDNPSNYITIDVA